ncbi:MULTISPECIES: hypothetical protein [Bacillaceae]|uniref:hypothetical protein n=1 Tax=Bacillaceae TaxID=186817 RepID=UPI000BFB7B0B|nr:MULTISPECIES: hypothetical protein [Bacillaceae]PGT90701.1 hypothetical protein COD11_02215 [Bacillus sp. AFS040349]UGB32267.1 hypothetical protein LPC09_07510 [Metabacillus sp. B2-18]
MKKTLLLVFLFICLSQKQALAANDQPRPHISFQPVLLSWDVVNEIIPRKSSFAVIDIDSGQSFKVQRRAGSGHADVQPLTKDDTKIMKKIYNGKWSWRRRAVFILIDDQLIPASMHGMPHGAGAIQNGFPGHFCIHFSGSTTHRTRKFDLSHHVMILKAAGKFDDYTASLSAEEILNIFLITAKNHDKELMEGISISNMNKNDGSYNVLNNIEGMKWTIKKSQEDHDFPLVSTFPVETKIYLDEVGPVKITQTFTLIRTSLFSPWKVMRDPFVTELAENGR